MKFLLTLNKYRFDVYLLFTAIATAMWSQLPLQESAVDIRLIVGAVFLSGLVWVYLFNKLMDRVEDAVSQPAEMLSLSVHVFFK